MAQPDNPFPGFRFFAPASPVPGRPAASAFRS